MISTKTLPTVEHTEAPQPTATPSLAEAFPATGVRIMEIELSQMLPTLLAYDQSLGKTYETVLAVIRLHSTPLGMVEIPLDEAEVAPAVTAQYIWRKLQVQIQEHLQEDGLPTITRLGSEGIISATSPTCLIRRERSLAYAPFVSIIVPVYDQPESLARCLRSLQSLRYPHYEVIVVDTTADTAGIASMVRRMSSDMPQVHYVRAERAGMAIALNTGVALAHGEILAFTQDSAVVDPYWLTATIQGFAAEDDVACVTGLVLPAELETASQLWFEEYGGFGKGFTRKIFDLDEYRGKSPLFPFDAGKFGTGASMAFTASFLSSIGGFDPALTHSEDLAAFFQVISAGYRLVYEPTAMLYNEHHRDYKNLRDQIHQYGKGLSAYVTKSICDSPNLAFEVVTKLPYGAVYTLSPWSPKNKKKSVTYPAELNRLEQLGMAQGVFDYLGRRINRGTRNLLGNIIPTQSQATGQMLNASPASSQIGTPRTAMSTVTDWVKANQVMIVNAASIVGTVGVTTLLGFFYWWAAAHLFTPAAVGFASALISSMTLLGTISMLGFGTLLVGELPRQKGKEMSIIVAALLLVAIVGGIAGIGFAIFAPFLSHNFLPLRSSLPTILLFSLGVSLSAATQVLDQALIGLLQGKRQFWRNVIFAATKLAAIVAAGFLLAHTVGLSIYATWVFGLVFSVVTIAGFIVTKEKLPTQAYTPSWDVIRQLWKRAAQHHTMNMILQVPTLLLPVIVTVMLSPTANAWFYVAFMITTLVFVASYSLTTVLYAASGAEPEVFTQKIRTTLTMSVIIATTTTIILLIGTKQILGLFGHQYAEQAAWSLRILVIGALPEIIRSHYVAICRIKGTLAQGMLPIAGGTILELVAAAAGAHIGGLSGLCLGWVSALAVESLIMSPAVFRSVFPAKTQEQLTTATTPATSFQALQLQSNEATVS